MDKNNKGLTVWLEHSAPALSTITVLKSDLYLLYCLKGKCCWYWTWGNVVIEEKYIREKLILGKWWYWRNVVDIGLGEMLILGKWWYWGNVVNIVVVGNRNIVVDVVGNVDIVAVDIVVDIGEMLLMLNLETLLILYLAMLLILDSFDIYCTV